MITVEHLTKRCGNFTAVDDISFTIKDGHIYGFLGPNGAGKSTTMNIMTGCLSATSGEVKLNGYDIFEDGREAKKLIGYLPEIPPLYMEETPLEYLEFVASAKGIAKKDIPQEIRRVVHETHIEEMTNRLIKHLSKGYRQRVGIAQAILGDPEIVILDEPTVGLDPLQIIEIRELIKALGQEHTVILSSHILSEISAVCDYIIIISHGRIVASDTIEHLTASVDGHRIITLDVRGELSAVTDALAELQGAVNTSVSYGLGGCVRVSIETPSERDMREEVFRLFAAKDLPIVEMSTNDASLEDVFLRLTEESAPTPDGETPSEDGTDGEDDSGEDAADADSPYYGDDDNSDNKETPQDDYKPLFGGKQ